MKRRFWLDFEVLFSGWKRVVVECHWFSGGFTMAQKVRHLRQDLNLFLGEDFTLCFVSFLYNYGILVSFMISLAKS